MTDELEVMEDASGLDRRTFIKRGAIVGGIVWAAPAISALGPRAFAQENGTRRCKDISNIAIVFTANGTTYQAKYDLDDGCAGSGNAVPSCPEDPAGWGTGVDGCAYISWNTDDPCCWEATINLPGPLEITSVVGYISGGGPSDDGFCVNGNQLVSSNGGNTYRWCSPTIES